MSNFSVGERAIHVGGGGFRSGEMVEIVAVGPFPAGTRVTGRREVCRQPAGYHILSLEDGAYSASVEQHLRKFPGDSDSRCYIAEKTLKIFKQGSNSGLPVGPQPGVKA